MQAIEERSDGRWRPSPGSIYPTLAQLEDEGLIRGREREGAKLFEVTQAGHDHLAAHRHGVPPWASDEEPEALAALRGEIKQLHIAAVQVAHAGQEDQVARAAKALAGARRDIYRILAEEVEEDDG
jgi:DNA-binding PadR family transcriptional regulator